MTITRNVAGMELKIELNSEEIERIVKECAVITVNPAKVTQVTIVPETVPEPAATEPDTKKYTLPKVIRTGCFKDHKEEVLDMITKGYTQKQIAAYFGVSTNTVGRWSVLWGMAKNHAPKGLTMKDGIRMLALRERGDSLNAIAEQYGIRQATVSYWISKAKEATAA